MFISYACLIITVVEMKKMVVEMQAAGVEAETHTWTALMNSSSHPEEIREIMCEMEVLGGAKPDVTRFGCSALFCFCSVLFLLCSIYSACGCFTDVQRDDYCRRHV